MKIHRDRTINVPLEVHRRVAKQLGLAESTMNQVLSGKRGARRGKCGEARRLLLESGEAVVENTLPESEVIRDYNDKLEQIFPNGYVMIADKGSGVVIVYSDLTCTEVKASYYNVQLSELAGIQKHILSQG